MTDTKTREPAEIAREIRETQDAMSRTVNSIGEQFTPRNILNALLDKAESNHVDARALLEGARRNPLALGLIAAGGIWLVSDSDAKLPSAPARAPKEDNPDKHHFDRGYAAHMSQVEPRADEDDFAYHRRRDVARASYLMIERRHGEEEGSFRQRLDEATDHLRQRVLNVSHRLHDAGDKVRANGRSGVHQVQAAYDNYPLLGGLAAAFMGAIAGSVLPPSQTEIDRLGPIGAKAIDEIESRTHAATDELHMAKDELVDQGVAKMKVGQG